MSLQVQLTENEIKYLCINARDVFMAQPILLALEAPIKICGDALAPAFPPGEHNPDQLPNDAILI